MSSVKQLDLGGLLLEVSDEKIYCVADLHLCVSRPHEIIDFANEVADCSGSYSLLLILGDLFDVYVGPEDLRAPEFAALFTAFDEFSSTGRVIVIRGNRDVLLSPQHAAKYSFDVSDVVIANQLSQRTLYLHGDVFCSADLKYQRLRKLLRCRPTRLLLRLLPVFVRRKLGRRMRQVSTAEVARKEMGEMQLDFPAIAAAASRFKASNVVVGHLHKAQTEQITANCRLEVLSAWHPRLTSR
ncbi:MAG: metallophosphoesterase [Planctomycetes bacterium]|nr:metallophosphoesterase [Planctomycetota bacterium]